MTRLLPSAALALVLAGPPAAECYADYKAKRDEPPKLHYGVAQVSDGNCSPGAAEGESEGSPACRQGRGKSRRQAGDQESGKGAGR